MPRLSGSNRSRLSAANPGSSVGVAPDLGLIVRTSPGHDRTRGGWGMKLVILAGLLATLVPAGAMAQSAIDGTWKVDLDKVQMPKKPDVYLLQNGTYDCRTCAPPISVKADGTDQKVTGHPYYDTIALQVVD